MYLLFYLRIFEGKGEINAIIEGGGIYSRIEIGYWRLDVRYSFIRSGEMVINGKKFN